MPLSFCPTATNSGTAERWLLRKSSDTEQRVSIRTSFVSENIEIYNERTLIQLPAQALLQMLPSQVGVCLGRNKKMGGTKNLQMVCLSKQI